MNYSVNDPISIRLPSTKQMSATLSSNAQVLVTHFSFLASHPSAMSLMPQSA